MKTIEEKAKEYESNIGSQDYVSIEIEEAFKAGANWMLENVVRWLKDNAKDFSENADELIKQFEDAMEE